MPEQHQMHKCDVNKRTINVQTLFLKQRRQYVTSFIDDRCLHIVPPHKVCGQQCSTVAFSRDMTSHGHMFCLKAL